MHGLVKAVAASLCLWAVIISAGVSINAQANSSAGSERAASIAYSLGVCTGLHNRLGEGPTRAYAEAAVKFLHSIKVSHHTQNAFFWSVFGEGRGAYNYRAVSPLEARNLYSNKHRCELLLKSNFNLVPNIQQLYIKNSAEASNEN